MINNLVCDSRRCCLLAIIPYKQFRNRICFLLYADCLHFLFSHFHMHWNGFCYWWA